MPPAPGVPLGPWEDEPAASLCTSLSASGSRAETRVCCSFTGLWGRLSQGWEAGSLRVPGFAGWIGGRRSPSVGAGLGCLIPMGLSKDSWGVKS